MLQDRRSPDDEYEANVNYVYTNDLYYRCVFGKVASFTGQAAAASPIKVRTYNRPPVW